MDAAGKEGPSHIACAGSNSCQSVYDQKYAVSMTSGFVMRKKITIRTVRFGSVTDAAQ